MVTHEGRQTDKKTDRKADRQAGRWTDWKADRTVVIIGRH